MVETDSYFLTVLRYIYQNPYKAGIVKNIGDYRWSSYGEYVGGSRLCDVEFGLSLFSRLAAEFSKEKNVTQREIMEAALIEFFRPSF